MNLIARNLHRRQDMVKAKLKHDTARLGRDVGR
jgi:hypothetical protein